MLSAAIKRLLLLLEPLWHFSEMLLLLALRFSLAAIFSLIFFGKLEMGLDMCEAERDLILFLSGSRKQF